MTTSSSSSPTTPRPSICGSADDLFSHAHLDIISFPPAQTIRIVAELLENIIAQNDKLPQGVITHFHSRSVPKIPVHAYLSRIQKFAPFSNEVLITILVYFDRIARRQSSFVISSYNIHRLLITSLTVASKFVSDVFYANARYAKVGGLPLVELNRLELDFLFLCNFDLYVRVEDLQEYADQLLSRTNERERTDCSLPQSPISSVSDESSTAVGFTPKPTTRPVGPENFMSPRHSPATLIHKTSQTALMTPPPSLSKQTVDSSDTSSLPRKRRCTSNSWSNPVPSTRHATSTWMTDTMRAGF
ncbi:cyclin-domain-containing protein [Umbelopsis sp. PMI_123]|nr:cyclin-domain-containing protein [Umbelopsis sp. PMI_123]